MSNKHKFNISNNFKYKVKHKLNISKIFVILLNVNFINISIFKI